MLRSFLLPDLESRECGEGPAFDLETASGQSIHLTFGVTRIVEQECLNVSIQGSMDGETWEAKPLFSFPKKSYCGTYSAYIDLAEKPDVRYLRATWQMCRWDRKEPVPLFGFFIKAEVVRASVAVA